MLTLGVTTSEANVLPLGEQLGVDKRGADNADGKPTPLPLLLGCASENTRELFATDAVIRHFRKRGSDLQHLGCF